MRKIQQFSTAAGQFLARHRRWAGLPLVYAAVVLLAALYLLGLTSNLALLVLTALVPVGIAGHVYQEKHRGRY